MAHSSSYSHVAGGGEPRHNNPEAYDNYSSHPDNHNTHSDHNSSLPAPISARRSTRQRNRPVKKTRGIRPSGESGRRGFHPLHFIRISFRSTSRASLLCNLLWPVVPAAIAVKYALPHNHELIFILSYIAMIPPANMVGFAGQELARKLPHVFGILFEIGLGSIVEIILFMILLNKDLFYVIKAAILGSILATMLLCLGFCFFVGGLTQEVQTFNDAISEAGSGLLLTAGVVLAIPTVFGLGLSTTLTPEDIQYKTLRISRVISVLLIIAYLVYVWFQARTHHGIYDAIYEADEHRDREKVKNERKAKLTLTECLVALVICIGLVAWIAVILVLQIEDIIKDTHVSEAFMGLILVPLVEKFAEHLTAVDEAWDNQMNFALSHVLGATLQTCLFNGPLTIVVGWGLNKAMDLNFDVLNLVMLILAILTVGHFLQDQKSNYLEGFLLITLYTAIAASAWYFPNPPPHGGAKHAESGDHS